MSVTGKRQRSSSGPISRILVSGNSLPFKKHRVENVSKDLKCASDAVELGEGTPSNPFFLPLRSSENASMCWHCPQLHCECIVLEKLLAEAYETVPIKRITEVAGVRQLCAKSLLPAFVARFIRLMNISNIDTFYDLGCGNGSILFQTACLTGAHCIGIEISEHNAELARQAWPIFRAKFEKHFGKRVEGSVHVITGDIGKLMTDGSFFKKTGRNLLLLSNLLFPKALTHFISERLREAPAETQVLCFDDLYPHGRSLAAIRDPEAFRLFDMKDYMWQEMSVEWCAAPGKFYIHRRR